MRERKLRPFHLAFPVKNIQETKKWYIEILGCKIGREAKDWVDFDFFGHQISLFNVQKTQKFLTNQKIETRKWAKFDVSRKNNTSPLPFASLVSTQNPPAC